MASETDSTGNAVLMPTSAAGKGYPEINPKVTLDITHFGVHYFMQGHPLNIGSIGYVPPRRTEIPADSYYNTPTHLRKAIRDDPSSQYGYDQKSRHENRKHNRHHCLRIHTEEDSRRGVIPEETVAQLKPVAGSRQHNTLADEKKFYK